MLGTLINAITVLVGGTIGLLFGNRLPEKTRHTVMHGLGLATLVVGMQMALTTQNVLVVIFSVLLGGIVGEWWRLDDRLEALGDWFQQRLVHPDNQATSRVSEGFVTASLVFCVGPMTVLGALQDGLTGNFELLAIKGLLDGFAAMAFASVMGWGVLLSVFTILIYQGGISLGAMLFAQSLAGSLTADTPALVELTATGGVLILGIGLGLLDIKRIRVANFLPALVFAPLLVFLVQHLIP